MKNKKRRSYSPIFVIAIITLIIMIASFVFSIIGIDGQKSVVANGTLESSLSVVKNIFSIDGLQYIFTHITKNATIFEPLILLIISLMGISVGTTSGFFKAIFSPLKKCNLTIITFLTLLIGIISSILGESVYVMLIPFTAIMYQYIGRNPMVGAITAFLGITVGFGTNIFFGSEDYFMGNLTQLAASAEVDKAYQFHLAGTSFIMVVSTIVIAFIGTVIINRFLANKLPKKYKVDEEFKISKKGMIASIIAFVVLLGIVIYMVVPGLKLPASGCLLDFKSDVYVEQLLGSASPFKNGIVLIITTIIIVCSYIYGRVSGAMKDNHEYGISLSKSFKDLGYLFVLMFFLSVLSTVLTYTNLGQVVAVKLTDFISSLPVTGIPLILLSFFIIIVISILVPSLTTKWTLMSPVIVPLFMRANITPDFTQFIFKAADGIGKCFSPIFIYFIVLVGFLDKYNTTEEDITIFGTLKLMLPAIILFTVLWLLIIIGWYVVGLPLGGGSYPTL